MAKAAGGAALDRVMSDRGYTVKIPEGYYPDTYKNDAGDVVVIDGEGNVITLANGTMAADVADGTISRGAYVDYSPALVTLDNSSQIIQDLTTYSGNTSSNYNKANSTNPIKQDNLSWRVLDITQDGKVRLISDKPTTSRIALRGARGYNNGVKLIDDTCATLYSLEGISERVENLKIEDIEKHSTDYWTNVEVSTVIPPRYNGTAEYDTNKYYPDIFALMKAGWVDNVRGTEYDRSQQTAYMDSDGTEASTKIKATHIFWSHTYSEITKTSDWKSGKDIYFDLFLDNNGEQFESYWMSSRSVRCADVLAFQIHTAINYAVNGTRLTNSAMEDNQPSYGLRPVVTLKQDVFCDVIE